MRLGVASLPIALFIATFTGIVLALLASYSFTGAVPLYFVGTLVEKTITLELAPVRVNALHPGIVGDSPAWEEKAAVLDATREKTPTGGSYLHPRQVLRELEKAMPADVMVSTDIGNINSVANSYLRFEKPRSFFAPMMSTVPTITPFGSASESRP